MELVTKLPEELKLDLGCGDVPREGFEGVDLYATSAKHRVNLLRFPWPWDTGEVSEISTSHFVEHIPMCYASGSNIPLNEDDLDLWCAFFGECWRVLKDGGIMTVQVPYLQSHRAFQDPTHRRFHCETSFHYLNRPWRKANKIEHYLGLADFDVISLDRLAPNEESLKHPEVSAARAMHYWNTTMDIVARLQAVKTPRKDT